MESKIKRQKPHTIKKATPGERAKCDTLPVLITRTISYHSYWVLLKNSVKRLMPFGLFANPNMRKVSDEKGLCKSNKKTEQNKIKQNDNCSRRRSRQQQRQRQRENNQRHLNWFAARISQVSKSRSSSFEFRTCVCTGHVARSCMNHRVNSALRSTLVK